MSGANGEDRMDKRVQGRLHGYRRDSADFKTRRLLEGFWIILLFDAVSCSIAVVSRSTVAYVLHSSVQMYCSSSKMGTR